jgi:hypothetical protein
MTSLFNNVIDSAEKISLSDAHIKSICGCNVVLYDTLADYTDIDELLDKQENEAFVLLYPINSDTDGHYVGVLDYRRNGYIEIFDSYALGALDEELTHIVDASERANTPKLLTGLIANKYRVVLNPTKLQEYSTNINTCGRHVAMRCKFKKTCNIREYLNLINGSPTGPDETVALATILYTL